MPLKVNLRVVMTENAKGEKIESIESIRRPEDEMCYIFPPEYQERKYHQQLFSLPIAKKTANSLTKADALSRNPSLESFENEEEVLKVANIIKKQDIIRDQKENREDIKNKKDLIKKSEIFFLNIKGRQRIFISQEFGEYIIKTMHDFFGYVGRNHILKKIRPFYYFKNVDRIVDKFCKQCEICIRNKSRTRRPIGLMSRLGPARKPFEIMSFDTVGGFTNNNSPKKYMHILIDHFSRAVFMSTSKTQRTEDIIKLINSTEETDSIKIILADRYPAMTSKEIQEYVREKNIKLIFTLTD